MKKFLVVIGAAMLCMCFSCSKENDGKISKEKWKEAFERVEFKGDAEASSFLTKDESTGFHAMQIEKNKEDSSYEMTIEIFSVPGTAVVIQKSNDANTCTLQREFASGTKARCTQAIVNNSIDWVNGWLKEESSLVAMYEACIKACKEYYDVSDYDKKSKVFSTKCYMCMEGGNTQNPEVKLEIPEGWTEENQETNVLYDCDAEMTFGKDENKNVVLEKLKVDYIYHYDYEPGSNEHQIFNGSLEFNFDYPENVLSEVPAGLNVEGQFEKAKTESDIPE